MWEHWATKDATKHPCTMHIPKCSTLVRIPRPSMLAHHGMYLHDVSAANCQCNTYACPYMCCCPAEDPSTVRCSVHTSVHNHFQQCCSTKSRTCLGMNTILGGHAGHLIPNAALLTLMPCACVSAALCAGQHCTRASIAVALRPVVRY